MSEELPPLPEPLGVPVLDSHTHLDLQGARDTSGLDAAIAGAVGVGVRRLIQVGTDTASSAWGAEIAAARPEVWATVALHPNEAPRLAAESRANFESAMETIEDLAQLPQVRGIGETGLDHFRTEGDGLAVQEESFRRHIALAKSTSKALVIHDRDAHEDVLRVLQSEGAPEKVIFHCFSGDKAFAQRCLSQGYVLSFAGTVTFKNAPALREAAQIAPIDQVLVETDAPFLTPTPYRGRPNSSAMIPYIVRFLAQLRNDDLDTLCSTIFETGERLFGPL